MATTYTPRLNLAKPATADRNWGATANTTFDSIEALAPIGALNVATAETPSASANVKVAAGTYQNADGSIGTYAGTASQAISGTQVVYLDGTGTLTVGASYPSSPHTRLATVTASGGLITSIVNGAAVLRRPLDALVIGVLSVVVWLCESAMFVAVLPALGLAVGLTASLLGLSRVLRVEPALAFGGVA